MTAVVGPAPLKKDKKINVMESQVLDPAAYDNPEFEVVTAWRPDRLKRLTYTQLWFLIQEHKVKQVRAAITMMASTLR